MAGLQTLAIVVACGFLTAAAAPALAGPPTGRAPGAGTPAHGQAAGAAGREVSGEAGGRDEHALTDGRGHKDANPVKDAKIESPSHSSKATKSMDGRKPRGADAAQSNTGGRLRGLDRADEVAGEHGKQGRDNARAKQDR